MKVFKIILLAITLKRMKISNSGFHVFSCKFCLLSDYDIKFIPCDLNFRNKIKKNCYNCKLRPLAILLGTIVYHWIRQLKLLTFLFQTNLSLLKSDKSFRSYSDLNDYTFNSFPLSYEYRYANEPLTKMMQNCSSFPMMLPKVYFNLGIFAKI